MKRIFEKYSCPVFAFGDMNSTIEEGVFSEYAENGINKLFDLAEERDETCSIHGDPKRDENGVYRGVVANKEYIKWFRNRLFLREDESLPDYFTSIDHIVSLGDGFTVKQYRIVEDQGALDATDHSPVYADVEIL
jgi:endonuclease/exonuclease/phosphatase family metal-dependent hydrolase